VGRAGRFPWRVGWVLIFAIGALLVAPMARADAPLFTVSQQDRYGGDADGDGKLDPDGSHLPRELGRHPIRLHATAAACGRARWRVDGRPAQGG
jgi:hypothetical protein